MRLARALALCLIAAISLAPRAQALGKVHAGTAIAVHELHNTPEIMNRIYDELAPWLESDGHFDPQAIELSKNSFVDMGILDKKPSSDDILTTKFVPVKP